MIVADRSGIVVACGEHGEQAISILEAQPEGRKAASAGDLVNGRALAAGMLLGALLARCASRWDLDGAGKEGQSARADLRRVIAGADCGFASFAGSNEVHPSIVWAKFKSLVDGARIASKQLWKK